MSGKLNLDPGVVAEARRLAALAAEPVIELARTHTTVSVERATLRLAGLPAIASGTFGITRRPADGGKGLDGVVPHAEGYVNPAVDLLEEGMGR